MSDNTHLNKKALATKTLTRFLSALIIVGCTLFISAGSLYYWNAWLFIAAIFIPMFFTSMYLIAKDPELLEKRLKTKEKQERQKLVQKIGIGPIIAGFLLPGFDFRYGWSGVPIWLVIVATIFLVLGYVLVIVVMKQNSYASRVIEVQEDQKVIDYGLYSKVRHPMYLSSIVIVLFSPLVLGSYYAIIPLALYPVILIIRLENEEEVLKKELKGYDEYIKKVKYRLIPLIW
jgi:protein-S-isoprenylcysteine O-methyltransferase Ste14